MPPTKRKSTYDTSDPFVASESGSPAPPSTTINPNKRSKASTAIPSSSSSSSKIAEKQVDEEGNPFWLISTARRVMVSDFKGKKMISVREYYQKDGVWLPGKKGITMTLEQYTELVKVLPQIEIALGEEGEQVGRPDYGDVSGNGHVEDDKTRERAVKGENNDDDDDDDDDEEHDVKGIAHGKARKANFDATSDEDEG